MSQSVTSPALSTFSAADLSDNGSPATAYSSPEFTKRSFPLASVSPNQSSYYSEHLNKLHFNLILINSAIKLLRILYTKNPQQGEISEHKLRFFIVEILRRSKTSTQLLQLACYYVYKLIKLNKQVDICPRKLFLTLIILASKFNQDYNYSFKSWLKICGLNDNEFTIRELRSLEMNTLSLLDYELYLNNEKYENWCNVLMIFSYDFIKQQRILLQNTAENQLTFELDDVSVTSKLTHWRELFTTLELNANSSINFKSYFNSQKGSKVIFIDVESERVQVPSLFTKRSICAIDEKLDIVKKFKYSTSIQN